MMKANKVTLKRVFIGTESTPKRRAHDVHIRAEACCWLWGLVTHGRQKKKVM